MNTSNFASSMGRRRLRGAAGVLVLALVLAAGTSRAQVVRAASTENVVLQWNEAALQGVRDSTLGAPMVARAMAVVHTCIYDAWAAYDPVATGPQTGGSLRQTSLLGGLLGGTVPAASKNEAMSFAGYRCAVDMFPRDRPLFDGLMAQLGYDPAVTDVNTSSPSGVGNAAAQKVLAFRHNDASNQTGVLSANANAAPYSDYTGYQPVNEPMVVAAPFDRGKVHDVNHWQPLTYVDATGRTVTPPFVGAQWGNVVPFALLADSQFRSLTGPARLGSAQFLQQARDLITLSANLTDEQKMIAEYWGLGPNTNQPPGQWDVFAEFVSLRDHHTVDQDAKMFFVLTNAIMDAGIAAWDDKRAFDSVRPITAIRWLFQGQQIQSWGGPGKGTVTMDGSQWLPYQKSTFPTPPFPEYASGHSTFSAAGAEILKDFTGSDAFGDSVTFPAGSSTTEPGVTPRAPVTLSWPTFSAAADEAGISRRYGGIHFEQGDLDGRELGRLVADNAWTKANLYFLGLAS